MITSHLPGVRFDGHFTLILLQFLKTTDEVDPSFLFQAIFWFPLFLLGFFVVFSTLKCWNFFRTRFWALFSLVNFLGFLIHFNDLKYLPYVGNSHILHLQASPFLWVPYLHTQLPIWNLLDISSRLPSRVTPTRNPETIFYTIFLHHLCPPSDTSVWTFSYASILSTPLILCCCHV